MVSSPHSLELDPEAELTFILTQNESTPRCTLTLKHPGTTDEHIAFKIKTTQPRRYLVRPNQGLIPPRGSETVSIILVDKDRQTLMQSYDRLGQSGLDHSKDKFLVQSCVVSSSFASKLGKDSNELYEALTSMWNSVASAGSKTPLSNKKLHVRHVVQENNTPQKTKGFKPEATKHSNMDNMTADQLKAELGGLRRKYDELVTFTVNLTAERDILSNTLEQTKRDMNREIATRSALENKQGGGKTSVASAGGSSVVGLLLPLMVVGFACLLGGIRLGVTGNTSFLDMAPPLKAFLLPGDEDVDPIL